MEKEASMAKEEYEKEYSDAMEDIGVAVIQMSDLMRDFMDVRYRISRGESFLLTHSSKAIAYIRPLTEEDLIADEKKGEDDQMEIWGIEDIRTNRDEFIFNMKDGRSIILGYRSKTLALITSEVPHEYLEKYNAAWATFASLDRKGRWEERRKQEMASS